MSEKRDNAGLEMRVIDFVSNQLSVSKDTLSLQSSLYEDFGVDGDDGVEFIEAFSNEFDVNISTVKYEKHFQPEGGVTPFFMFYPFLYLLKWIFGWKPEQKKYFIPIRIIDLINSAEKGMWTISYPDHEDAATSST